MSKLILLLGCLVGAIAIMVTGLAGMWREITGESWKASFQVSMLLSVFILTAVILIKKDPL